MKISSLECYIDLNSPNETSRVEKDIAHVSFKVPSLHPHQLLLTEQQVLGHIYKVVGHKPSTEFRLPFAPNFIIDKAMHSERDNYIRAGAYKEFDVYSLPRGSSIISSHQFLVVKHDGKGNQLNQKCRLLPHGSRDFFMEEVVNDATTAQFPPI